MFSLYDKSNYKLAHLAQKKKLKTISLLMLVSQVLLLLFVSEWIRVQYHEQERRLNNDLQNIFARTEERLSDSLLDHTVSIILKTPGNISMRGMEVHVSGNADEPLENIKDSVIKTFRFSTSIDTADSSIVPRPSKQKIEQIVVKNSPKEEHLPENMKRVLRVALLQTANARGVPENILTTSLNNKLLKEEFSKDLLKKAYTLKVYEDSTTKASGKLFFYKANTPDALPIKVSGYSGYLFKAILPQVIFSILLLLLTGVAFWLAYKNMRQQAIFSEQKDSLISNISHELKTPVATTKVALEALNSFNAIDDPVRTRKYLQVAEWEMKRLENMIDKIMNIMQTETAKLILHKESVILFDLLAEITTTMQPILSQKNIILDKEGVDDHVLVSADKTHMTGALYNIMDNAIKYGGDHIELKLAAKGDQAVLKIRDNGQGIPPGYHKKVFEHFFRVPSGNKHDVKGHGLGLSYARQIIEAHGGHIQLESSPGNGATFIIVFPQSRTV